jgi:hypothetical protein
MKDSTDMKTNGKDVNTQAANMPEFTPDTLTRPA